MSLSAAFLKFGQAQLQCNKVSLSWEDGSFLINQYINPAFIFLETLTI